MSHCVFLTHVLSGQATFRLLKGARTALGDMPHVDMLLHRLMLALLHRVDTALFHKLVGGAFITQGQGSGVRVRVRDQGADEQRPTSS